VGDLGSLLEALYEAPRAIAALHVRAHETTDATVLRRVHEWWQAQQPGPRSHGVLLVASDGSDDDSSGVEHELWWAAPDRWRAHAGDRITVLVDDEQRNYTPRIGGFRSAAVMRWQPPWASLLRPRWIFERLHIEVGGTAAVAGRDCWSVELRIDAESIRPGANRFVMPPWLGQEHTCQVDCETGVVLAYEGRFEGAVCSTWTTTAFEVVDSLDEGIFHFEPPDGRGFLSPVEHRAASMRAAGVDLTGVDVDDGEQLMRAMMRHHQSLSPAPTPPEPITTRDRADQHIPTGPPPDDETAAEAQIRAAFEGIVTPSEDGASIPTVQGGSNLGSCLGEAGPRSPGGVDTPAYGRVKHIKFLSTKEAVVWFTLDQGGRDLLGTMEGRAYLVGARWLVARPTFCHIVGTVGVRCPPPPADEAAG
jgi:hypothetical protein